MDDIDQQREHFESVALHYTQARKSPRHQLLKRIMWKHALSDDVLRALPADRPVRLLEPMCGSCEGRIIFEERIGKSVDYKGFDYSPTMVALAQEAFPDANIWEADVTQYDPEPGSSDLVMVVGSLHHVARHAPKVVAKLATAVAPGGLFVVAEPTNNNPLMRVIRERIYRNNENFDAETERGFTGKELDAMFHAAGLDSVSKTYPTMLAYVLWGNPEAFPILDKGPISLVEAYINFERLFWSSALAKTIGFGTFAVYGKPVDAS